VKPLKLKVQIHLLARVKVYQVLWAFCKLNVSIFYIAKVSTRSLCNIDNDDYLDDDDAEGDLTKIPIRKCMCYVGVQIRARQNFALSMNSSQILMKLGGLLVMFAHTGITNIVVALVNKQSHAVSDVESISNSGKHQ